MPVVLLMRPRQVNLQTMQKLLHQTFQGCLLRILKQKSIGQTSEQSTEEASQSSNLDRDMQDHAATSSVNDSLPNSGQLDGECPTIVVMHGGRASGHVRG
jgi:hypothetical protein